MARAKLILSGVSHWHCRMYLEPLLTRADVDVVGVADPDEQVVRDYQRQLGCAGDVDLEALCARTRPDFAVVLGRHCDMAADAQCLLERGTPFLIEKPCGLTGAEVAGLAARAAELDAFVTVPFVWRMTGMTKVIERALAEADIRYASFRLIAGPPQRYIDAGCRWMTERPLAGGGCVMNLGIHFMDLFAYLTRRQAGGAVAVESAVTARVHGCSVEDYGAVWLRSGEVTCLNETGYLYPAATGVYDMHFAIMLDDRYFVIRGPDEIEVTESDGRHGTLREKTTNVPYYAIVTSDAMARVRRGDPPMAGLGDAAQAVKLVEDAYRHSYRGDDDEASGAG